MWSPQCIVILIAFIILIFTGMILSKIFSKPIVSEEEKQRKLSEWQTKYTPLKTDIIGNTVITTYTQMTPKPPYMSNSAKINTLSDGTWQLIEK